MEKAKVLVIGSLNMDLVVQTPRVPDNGETLTGISFNQYFGGKGANQAVAAARLGANVSMLGRVGADSFGQEQIASLQKEGIDTTHIQRDPHHASGVASITLDADGNNRIIIVPGANGACTPEDVDNIESLIKQVDIVVLQLEIPLDVVLHAVDKAWKLGIPVILNPAPAQVLPKEIYEKLTVFTPNESEATLLSGITVSDVESARKAAQHFWQLGVKQVIITLGSRGVYGLNEEGEFHIPVYSVKPVDTVAAGDAFTGALAVGLAEGKSLQEAAKMANAVAAIAVTRHGAQPSIPKRDEVMKFMEQNS